MKRVKIIILALFMFVPTIIKADAITCDGTNFNYGDEFACYVSVSTSADYDELSGTISTDNNIKCEIEGVGSGLTANQVASPKQQFSLKGKPASGNILKLECSVTAKLAAAANSQVVINDFKYHIVGSAVDSTELILRSSYITVNPYTATEEPTEPDTKPRDTSNNDSLLRSIYDENLDMSFSKFITIYDIAVLYEVESLNIVALPVNKDANVRIVGNQNLSLGKNVIDIYVTSPDAKTTTCYTLNVTRLARGEEIYYPKSDSTLESMTVIGHSIKFQKDVYEYHIQIDSDTDKVEVNPTPTNKEAVVDITDTNNLKDGSVIVITVTSADGTTETKYRIFVKKDLPKEDIKLYIFLGGVAVIGIGIVYGIIKTNKKEKDDPLLSIKKNKRKVKKGAEFDNSGVPEVGLGTAPNQALVQNPEPTQTAPNVITADSATAAIIQAAPPMEDTNRNKVTSLQSTIDLNVSANAAPIAMAADPTMVNQNINNVTASTLGEGASTLDLSGAVSPMDLNNQTMMQAQVMPNNQPLAFGGTQPINNEINNQNIAFNASPIVNQVDQNMVNQTMNNPVTDPYTNTNVYSDQNIIATSGPIQTIQLDQPTVPINNINPQVGIPEQTGIVTEPVPNIANPVQPQTIQLENVAPVQNIITDQQNPNNP